MPEKPKTIRCAVYTRKSTEHNLDLEFNSLDAQRESCEAYIKSQLHEGWQLLSARYDDGGISGGSLERPDLQIQGYYPALYLCRLNCTRSKAPKKKKAAA